MPRLTSFDRCELSETAALRERRDLLLRKAERHRYRLLHMPSLTNALKQATNELLRRELEAQQETKRQPEPLGDAGPVRDFQHCRLPYKDD